MVSCTHDWGPFLLRDKGQDEEEGTATEWVSRDKVANRVRKVESAIAAAEARSVPPPFAIPPG